MKTYIKYPNHNDPMMDICLHQLNEFFLSHFISFLISLKLDYPRIKYINKKVPKNKEEKQEVAKKEAIVLHICIILYDFT